MGYFLGGIFGIMLDPILIVICIFIVHKVKTYAEILLYAFLVSIVMNIILINMHGSLHPGLGFIIQGTIAPLMDASIIYLIYKNFIWKKSITNND